MSERERPAGRRTYRPAVESLEALRLFSGAAAVMPAAVAPLEVHPVAPLADGLDDAHPATWDAALDSSRVSEFLGHGSAVADESSRRGVLQVQKYLTRAWARAGISTQAYDDSTQAVFLTLLQQYGPAGFDRLMGDVGKYGIREVFSRETPEGPDFFRAVDTVKKRAQRMKVAVPMDSAAEVAAPDDNDRHLWRDAIEQAIERDLNPREADLIRATMRGESPMEIAQQWGLTPKTVSNEKTRAFQKLRASLSEVYN
ncbi:MAG: sigma-70 family RNA polymerase sigma factor [Isosphaeraceae bacterium]